MPGFLLGSLALAGVAAAAGPFVIHLLNRQRFRVVHWAAMDFLREAMRRSRRILHIRDVLLLCLRTLCLLCIGLGLARPQWGLGTAIQSGSQPVHAVLVLDNSLSMGYRKFDATLLDEAKSRAIEFIERLPAGSRISVLPLCGSANAFSRDAYRSTQDARDAINLVEVVDRSGSAAQAADMAIAACQSVTDLPTKRVVFLGDQQRLNFSPGALESRAANLPDLQIVQIAAENPENSWVEEVRAADGLADVETPATILAVLRHEGSVPRAAVPVTLSVDGVDVATRSIDLEPGQRRELEFSHQFNEILAPGQARFAAVSVRLPADKLSQDDVRTLSLPVVSALPVVFIDSVGADENPALNRFGETYPLRRLLAPAPNRNNAGRELASLRHITADEVTREALREARLVVVAGVERPDAITQLLREYVEQGGQLVIAAGGDFDPALWTAAAWQEGAGVLPLPLEPEAQGSLPEDTSGQLTPVQIAADSLVHDDFLLGETSSDELNDLYQLPLFFRVIGVQADEATLATLLKQDEERATQAPPVEDWLSWKRDVGPLPTITPSEAARRAAPRVLARFNNQQPYLVERRIGAGSVLFIASGIQSHWNNLARTNAVFLYDRLLRSRIARSLPERTIATTSESVFELNPADRRAEFVLERPGKLIENLSVDALGGERYGLTIRQLTQRGPYRLTARQTDSREKLWEVSLAANGPAAESELQSLDAAQTADMLGGVHYRLIPAGQPIRVEGADYAGSRLWAILLTIGLLGLALEMILLCWPGWTPAAPVTPRLPPAYVALATNRAQTQEAAR